MKLILASNSPRRRALLAQIAPSFEVESPRFSEEAAGLSACETARAFACGKAREVFLRFPDCAVLGADTVVALDGEVLGKPADAQTARRMLWRLSGRRHTVYTGVCLCTPDGERADTVHTYVWFNDLSDELIEAYVASGLPLDKAGAYGIQDGYPLVKTYEGSFSNVVGLPAERVTRMLREAGVLP